jgi:hypothetical protein
LENGMSDITHEFAYVTLTDELGKKHKEMALGIKRVAPLGMSPVFAIPLSSAWLYAEPEYMARATRKIAEFLGMLPDMFLMKRIADLILNYLPDLVASAPYVESQGVEIGEGKITINDVAQHFAVTSTGKVMH